MKNLIYVMMLAFGLVGSVSAAQIEYNFKYGDNNNYAALPFTESGVTTTATATYNGFANPAKVAWRYGGLGVKNPQCILYVFCDNPEIDGFYGDDYLTLSFAYDVDLLGLNFGKDWCNDKFDLYVDGVGVLYNQQTYGGWTDFALGTYSGKAFTIRADGYKDSFLLSGLRINVPEPTALIILAGGILGLCISRRRKS